MGHAQHGHAFVGEFDHDVKHFVDHFRVERGRWLVEQHDLRLHGEGAGDGDTLLLASGQLRRHFGGLRGHADAAQQIHGQVLGFLLVHVAHLDRCQCHVFQNGFVGEQVERLEHHAHFRTQFGEFLAFLRQRFAVDADIAGIDGFQTVDGAAHRGFARAGRSDDDEHLAFAYGEVDVLEHMQIAIMLLDMGQFDERPVIRSRVRHDGTLRFGFFHFRHKGQYKKAMRNSCFLYCPFTSFRPEYETFHTV